MVLDPAHQTQYILGLHEREVHRWLPTLARGALSAVDIGAASGEYSLYFLARTGAEQVFAFDPDLVSREEFMANLDLNTYANDPRLHIFSTYIRGTTGPDALTLDELLPKLRLPCVVKIDVDGAEADILAGGDAMLRTHQVRWLIETHSAELERECAGRLKEHGYHVTIIRNAWWRAIVPEQRPIAHNRWLVALPPNSR
jgi:hypothetical protein